VSMQFYQENIMAAIDTNTIIAEIIDAHGGETIWSRINWIDAEISASGFLFKAKHITVLNHAIVRASAKNPHFIFNDFPEKGQTGEFIGMKRCEL